MMTSWILRILVVANPVWFKKWDVNVAILSGDAMFAGAIQQLGYYGHNQAYSKQEFSALYDVFLQATTMVCEGQAMDMEFVNRMDVSLSEYIKMISDKTAALLSAALEMGAIAAHAHSEERCKLAKLGTKMGIAFQVQDDLLDATAYPEKFGKRTGGDIFKGKKTYLTILALERANKEQTKIIEDTLLNENPTEESVETVLKIMNQLKVLEDVSKEVTSTYEKAGALLKKFPESEYKKALENLLIFLQHRDH